MSKHTSLSSRDDREEEATTSHQPPQVIVSCSFHFSTGIPAQSGWLSRKEEQNIHTESRTDLHEGKEAKRQGN